MQLFQQWLQVAAATLHLEGLEEQKRREKEDRRKRVARRRTVLTVGNVPGKPEDEPVWRFRNPAWIALETGTWLAHRAADLT